MKIKAEVLNLNDSTDERLNGEINEVLNSSGYDFYDYREDIAISVDDQGFFKHGLPVLKSIMNLEIIRNLQGNYFLLEILKPNLVRILDLY